MFEMIIKRFSLWCSYNRSTNNNHYITTKIVINNHHIPVAIPLVWYWYFKHWKLFSKHKPLYVGNSTFLRSTIRIFSNTFTLVLVPSHSIWCRKLARKLQNPVVRGRCVWPFPDTSFACAFELGSLIRKTTRAFSSHPILRCLRHFLLLDIWWDYTLMFILSGSSLHYGVEIEWKYFKLPER